MAQSQVTDQAYVTLATNDSYGLGALTLGHSLRRVGANRSLVCMVTRDLSREMREELSRIFALVDVNILDSHDTVNLGLLTRPDLGVTFTKLHCWRLTQFSKCVFMDADTLVLQNINDLFEREEFSAASDVGWPDCFNSGVFVFKPSEETYRGLLQLALTRGSFDGGDQGLLNAYFSSWATKDIKYHLPFLYNVVAQTFYTYKPAFKRFGKDAKVLHFIGANKPWHGTYRQETGSVDCPGELGLVCQDFLRLWWEIFTTNVELSKDKLKDDKFEADKHSCSHWEQGSADYLGTDRSVNIQKQIESRSGKIASVPAVKRGRVESRMEQRVVTLIKETPASQVQSFLTRQPLEPQKSDLPGEQVATAVEGHVRRDAPSTSTLAEPPVAGVRSDDLDRRHKWEVGQVDYMGEDSFENILKRLDEKTKKTDQRFDEPPAAAFPMPAPAYRASAGRFPDLLDRDAYSSRRDVELPKFQATITKSPKVLTKEDVSSLELERPTKVKEATEKKVKPGKFKLQSASGEAVLLRSAERAMQEAGKRHPPEQPGISEETRHSDPKSAPERRLVGSYVFQSASDQLIVEPATTITSVATKTSLHVHKDDVSELGVGRSEPIDSKVAGHKSASVEDGSTIHSGELLDSSQQQKSIERFSDIMVIRKDVLKVSNVDLQSLKKSIPLVSEREAEKEAGGVAPAVKVSSSTPSSSQLKSGVKSIQIKTKGRSNQK